MIPTLHPIATTVRPLNERLWDLHRKCADKTATRAELDELEAICAALETDQDNSPTSNSAGREMGSGCASPHAPIPGSE